jgi:hypothetical protein
MPLNKGALTSALASMIGKASDAGSDPATVAAALADAIEAFVKSGQVNPTALIAPGGGGPVTGTGTIT